MTEEEFLKETMDRCSYHGFTYLGRGDKEGLLGEIQKPKTVECIDDAHHPPHKIRSIYKTGGRVLIDEPEIFCRVVSGEGDWERRVIFFRNDDSITSLRKEAHYFTAPSNYLIHTRSVFNFWSDTKYMTNIAKVRGIEYVGHCCTALSEKIHELSYEDKDRDLYEYSVVSMVLGGHSIGDISRVYEDSKDWKSIEGWNLWDGRYACFRRPIRDLPDNFKYDKGIDVDHGSYAQNLHSNYQFQYSTFTKIYALRLDDYEAGWKEATEWSDEKGVYFKGVYNSWDKIKDAITPQKRKKATRF